MFGMSASLSFQTTPFGMPVMGMPAMGMQGMCGGFPLAMYSNASMLMGPPVGAMMGNMTPPGMMMGSMMMGNMLPLLMQQMMMQQMQAMMMLHMLMMMQQMKNGANSGMPYTGFAPGFLPPPNAGGLPYGYHGFPGLGPGAGPGANFPSNLGLGAATLHGVPWFSQFDGSHVPGAGSMACFRASVAMAAAAGATVLGPGSRIQVGTGENGSGALSVDPQKAAQGRNYIDSQLAEGKPVVVGVSYAAGRDYNVDHLTDHFVLVTGRGQDEQGRTYYTFNDPGTTNGSQGSDKNGNNRFYVDDKTGKLYRPGSNSGGLLAKNYEVAMVRRNA